jgi:diaminopimelate epimerase
MRLPRWQAHGNVYLVAEAPLQAVEIPALAAGADGVIEVVARGSDWLEIRIWNPDGSQAEMSGNGTRIAARWLADKTGAEQVSVGVGPRRVSARMLDQRRVEQRIGPVTVGEPAEVAGIRFIPVDVGNPHAVVEDDPGAIVHVGPLLERHPYFPQRTNVQVVRRLGPDLIEARVWERGVGETGASGSSAIAIVAALGGGSATVRFPGGELQVTVEDGQALLIGNAEPLDEPG